MRTGTISIVASTKPRRLGRGRVNPNQEAVPRRAASTKPRRLGRGRREPTCRSCRSRGASTKPRRLGRGRDSLGVNERRLTAASTKPRRLGRGRTTSFIRLNWQRGASTKPRRLGRGRWPTSKPSSSSSTSFNEAAPVRTRKGPATCLGDDANRPGFNEAAPVRTRKVPARKSRFLRCFRPGLRVAGFFDTYPPRPTVRSVAFLPCFSSSRAVPRVPCITSPLALSKDQKNSAGLEHRII